MDDGYIVMDTQSRKNLRRETQQQDLAEINKLVDAGRSAAKIVGP